MICLFALPVVCAPPPLRLRFRNSCPPVLLQIQVALWERSIFDPATSDRVFAIGMSDFGGFTLLPRLVQTL